MSLYQFEIDDAEVVRQVQACLNSVFMREMRTKYGDVGDVLKAAVKDMVYEHKEEILDRVVDRATKEIVRKGLPMLLDRLDKGGSL